MKLPHQQAYALLRLVMGIDMFLHGATRIGAGVETFAGPIVKEFQATILPAIFVHVYAVTLPFVEGLLGLLLLAGLFTRQALVVASLVIASLVFGTALRSDWSTIGLQLIYAVIFYLLLCRVGDNCYSVDSLRRRAP